MTGNFCWVLPEFAQEDKAQQIWRAQLASSQRDIQGLGLLLWSFCVSQMRGEGRTVNFDCLYSHVTILRQRNGPKLGAVRFFFAVSLMKGCRFTSGGENST